MSEEESKPTVDYFGNTVGYMSAEQWDEIMEKVRRMREERRAVLSNQIMYYQCAYGL